MKKSLIKIVRLRSGDPFTNARGSVAVEAVLTLPLLLIFGLALVWLLLAARTEAALREAVEETVKTAAAYAYPVDLVLGYAAGTEQAQWVEAQISALLPETVRSLLHREWFGELSGGGEAEWSDLAVHKAWAEPLLRTFVDRNAAGSPLLDSERLFVKAVILPTFGTDERSYFGLEAEYRMKIPVPFFPQEIVFTAAALERCWVGEKPGGGVP